MAWQPLRKRRRFHCSVQFNRMRTVVSESKPGTSSAAVSLETASTTAQQVGQTVPVLTVEMIGVPELKRLIHFHIDQSSTLLNSKWCRQGTTFVQRLCDLMGMVTAKAQFNLKDAKHSFEEPRLALTIGETVHILGSACAATVRRLVSRKFHRSHPYQHKLRMSAKWRRERSEADAQLPNVAHTMSMFATLRLLGLRRAVTRP